MCSTDVYSSFILIACASASLRAAFVSLEIYISPLTSPVTLGNASTICLVSASRLGRDLPILVISSPISPDSPVSRASKTCDSSM